MRYTLLVITSLFLVTSTITSWAKGSSARSAVSGKYVSKGYAAKSPKTTVVEKRK